MKSGIFCIVLILLSACSGLPNPKVINTEFGQSAFLKNGSDRPTIILESGLGDNMNSWESVISSSGFTKKMFAYNRAGYSGSSSVAKERSADSIVKELRLLLDKTETKPPYILVGHSLGGLYMQLFAKKYPDDVLGVVLVDSTYEGTDDDCVMKNSVCEQQGKMPWWAKTVLADGVAGEHESMSESMRQVRDAGDFPQIPLVVLSRGKNPWEGNRSTEDWQKRRWIEAQENQKKLALLSSSSKQIICMSCGHYVHQDKPELVDEAIAWILDRDRQ